MPESSLVSPRPARTGSAAPAGALHAGWRDGLSILNLRGDPADAAFVTGAASALGLALPLQPCTSVASASLRLVWAGPDDWFVIGAPGQTEALASALRSALASTHHAVTDVGSGYTVLRLAGPAVRDVLAQGCPLDLHPRAFGPDAAAGSVFFKASVWLWRIGEAPDGFEMLVRRSFTGYVRLLLERCSAECGLAASSFTGMGGEA